MGIKKEFPTVLNPEQEFAARDLPRAPEDARKLGWQDADDELEILTIRLHGERKRALTAFANDQGIDLSSLIRQVLYGFIKEKGIRPVSGESRPSFGRRKR